MKDQDLVSIVGCFGSECLPSVNFRVGPSPVTEGLSACLMISSFDGSYFVLLALFHFASKFGSIEENPAINQGPMRISPDRFGGIL